MATIQEQYQDFKNNDFEPKFVALTPTPGQKIISLSPTINMISNPVVHVKSNVTESHKKYKEPDMHQKTMLSLIPDIEQRFSILGKIGEGTFSKVYMARYKNQSSKDHLFALKYLLPIVKPGRIAKEIRILRDMRGEANIIPLHSVLFNDGHAVIVMPLITHDKFSSYFQRLTPPYIRDYFKKLLTAVARIHQDHIVHRDIKPANFLYDHRTGKCALVDFGLSQTESEIETGMRQVAHKVSQLNRELEHPSTVKSSRTSLTNLKSRVNLESHFTDLVTDKKKEQQNSTITPTVISTLPPPPPPPPSSDLPELPQIQNEKSLKRKLDDSSRDEMPAPVDNELQIKKPRSRTPYKMEEGTSFMVSPVTPESKKIITPVVPETPYKKRSPMKELNYDMTVDCTLLSSVCMNFNQQFKTPVKEKATPTTTVSCLETPPKTVRQVPGAATTQCCQPSNLSSIHKTPIVPSGKSLLPPKKFLIFQDQVSNLKSSQRPSEPEGSEQSEETCDCREKAEVCFQCYHRLQEFFVPRAGTPGFRAPEVLLRASVQTCKIDIWSVGVMLASVLSGRYPFFRSVEDLTALAEITELFGSKKISQVASKLQRTFVIDKKLRPLGQLRDVIQRLRDSLIMQGIPNVCQLFLPTEAYDLLDGLLEPDPELRLTAEQALKHPFFSETLKL